MEIYNNIKLLRKKLKLTQTEFAEKLGMSLAGIQRWEASKDDIKQSSINLISPTYNVSKDWLLTGSSVMFNNVNAGHHPLTNSLTLDEEYVLEGFNRYQLAIKRR